MKKFLLVCTFFIISLLYSGVFDIFKEGEITAQIKHQYSYDFEKYDINIYNSASESSFKDVAIPDKLKDEISESALSEYFYSIREKVKEEEKLIRDWSNGNYQWKCYKNQYDNYVIQLGVTNTASYMIKEVTLNIINKDDPNEVHKYNFRFYLKPRSFDYGYCKIPYNLYNKIQNGNYGASIGWIKYDY